MGACSQHTFFSVIVLLAWVDLVAAAASRRHLPHLVTAKTSQ